VDVMTRVLLFGLAGRVRTQVVPLQALEMTPGAAHHPPPIILVHADHY
jgi:hypothetical protein